MSSRYEDVPLGKIIVADRARTDYGEIEELAENIAEHGVIQPISLDQDYRLLAGGRRYRAAEIAGLDTIPSVIRTVDSDYDRTEIELIENIYRKDLSWIERAHLERRLYQLKGSIREVADAADISKSAVHRHVQLAEALDSLPELAKCKDEAEAWKTLQKIKEDMVVKEITKRAKSRLSDEDYEALIASQTEGAVSYDKTPEGVSEDDWLFHRADNNYKIGDALEGMSKIEAPAIFGFAEVDPPYGISLDKIKRDAEKEHSTVQDYNEIPEDEYGDFLEQATTNVFRLLEANSFCVWWFGYTHYSSVLRHLRDAGFLVHEVPALWYKGGHGQTQQPDTHLASSYEPFFIARKGRPVLRSPGRSNVFHYPPLPSGQKIHATERPIELMQEILATFSSPGQKVLIPFLGSGVTLRACYSAEMIGLGWDLNQDIKNKFLIKLAKKKEKLNEE